LIPKSISTFVMMQFNFRSQWRYSLVYLYSNCALRAFAILKSMKKNLLLLLRSLASLRNPDAGSIHIHSHIHHKNDT